MKHLVLILAAASSASAQLLNTGFDTAVVPQGGMGQLPAPWSSTAPGNTSVAFDTWDDTGANGIVPTFQAVFSGVTAHSGHRWAGGWDFENMSQLMTAPLTPGQTYQIDAWIHAPQPSGGYLAGDFQFGLGATAASSPTIVAVFPATVTWAAGWVHQTATFTAPSNAATLPYFFPQIYALPGQNSYMGIDDVTVQAVPSPGSIAIAGVGGLLCLRRRRASLHR